MKSLIVVFTIFLFVTTELFPQQIKSPRSVEQLEEELLTSKISLLEYKTELNKHCSSLQLRSPILSLLDSNYYYEISPTTQDWDLKSKFLNTYSQFETPSLVNYFVKDNATKNIRPSRRTERKFNSEGVITENISWIWNLNSKMLQYLRKFVFNYKSNGNWDNDITYRWNSSQQDWEPFFKYDYYYDLKNKNLVETQIFTWDMTDKKWVNFEKYNYRYNSKDLQDTAFYYVWVPADNNWEISTRNERTYNDLNQLIKVELFVVDGPGIWLKESIDQYTFDINGNINSEYHELYNKDSMKIYPLSRGNGIFDSKNYLLSYKYEEWDLKTSQWGVIYETKYQNDYNSEGQITEVLRLNYNDVSKNYELSAKDNYYYSLRDLVSINEPQSFHEIEIVPNPFRDEIRIKNLKGNGILTLYGIDGKVVEERITKEVSEPINLSIIKPGSYIVKFQVDNKLYFQNLLKY